jgi:hypothetical protein
MKALIENPRYWLCYLRKPEDETKSGVADEPTSTPAGFDVEHQDAPPQRPDTGDGQGATAFRGGDLGGGFLYGTARFDEWDFTF